MRGIDELRTSLAELRQTILPDASRAPTDDEVIVRIAEIEIEIEALSVTVARRQDRAASSMVELKSTELRRRIAELGIDVLAYYAIPLEHPGANEPPVLNEQARKLKSDYLEAMKTDDAYMMGLKDRLSAFVLEVVS